MTETYSGTEKTMFTLESFIKTVARTRPVLFYYKADPKARKGIRVEQNDVYLEIIRPSMRSMIQISRKNYIYIVDMIESFDYFFDSAQPVTIIRNGEPLPKHGRAVQQHSAVSRLSPPFPG